MRIGFVTMLIILGAVALSQPVGFSQERQVGGVGLTVFTEPGFSGRSATIRVDTPNLQESGLNDRIVSLRVARGEQWEVCEDSKYRGRCVVVSGSESDLSQTGWSHTISSVRRLRGRNEYESGQSGRGGLVLYARAQFSGEQRRLHEAVPDLSDVGFDDRAMSLRVGPGESWNVCAETRYRDCQTVDDNFRDLGDLGMRHRISSVRRADRRPR
jgi:hypothetical protein